MMRTRLAFFTVLISVIALGAACVPTAARHNARLEEGFDVGLVGGGQWVGEGEVDDGTTSAPTEVLHAELDVQWAQKFSDDSGFAAQLKIPLNIFFSTLDLYYQFSESTGPWYFGFGVELSVLPGVYAVATHYFSDEFYISFTPRVSNAESRSENAALINPQFSLGFDTEDIDVAGFVSFSHHTGRGFDFDIDLFTDEDRKDYRRNFVLAGVLLRL
jgi:hypothetical protein